MDILGSEPGAGLDLDAPSTGATIPDVATQIKQEAEQPEDEETVPAHFATHPCHRSAQDSATETEAFPRGDPLDKKPRFPLAPFGMLW